MTQLDDLKTYLNITFTDDTYSDTTLAYVLTAETEAQAAFLKKNVVVATHPDLVQALFRRCARNLAMRALPLALTEGENGSSYVGARDPEIRRLEAPYRRRVVG